MKEKRKLPLHLSENRESKCFVFRHPKYQERRSVVFSYAKGKDRGVVQRKAVEFTRRKNKTLPKPEPQSTVGRLTTRNTSQVVGVSPVRRIIRKPSGRELAFFSWRAAWVGCPHAGGVTWPCKTHGCKDAFVLAVLTRAMRSVNRRRILESLEAIRGTDIYREIVRKKSIHKGCNAAAAHGKLRTRKPGAV
jgi:hypothetical protein